jgi:hypothetical protein
VPIAFTLAPAPSSSSNGGGGGGGGGGVPTSTAAQVVATYSRDTGEAWAQTLDVALPLCMFCQVVQPIKEAGEPAMLGRPIPKVPGRTGSKRA